MSDEDNELDDIGTIHATAAKRVLKLGQVKSFDGELARRELRDEAYPLFMLVADILAELDNRIGALEEGSVVTGIEQDLAELLLTAIARGQLAAEIAVRTATPGSDDAAAAAEVKSWFDENAAGLVDEVNTITVVTEDESDENEEEGYDSATDSEALI